MSFSPGGPPLWLVQAVDESKLDRVFNAFGARLRRRLLHTLGEGEGSLSVPDGLLLRRSDPEDIEQELMRVHLPELENAGYIEWDRTTGEISRGPNFDEIEPLLDLIAEHRDELPPDWI